MNVTPTAADAYRLFHHGALALARAERCGIRVDVEYCARKAKQIEKKTQHLQAKLDDTKLFRQWKHIYGTQANVQSGQQLSRLLYHHMKIEPAKTTTSGEGATDEEALKRLDVPGLDLVLQIRKMHKIRSTYLEAFIREQTDGFIHPSFHLHTVRTYRSSSEGPNFQNIPKRDEESMKICRRAIIPRPGRQLVEADFSALEVNISECYHKDPVMMKYLLDKKSDMHLDMAKQIFMFPEMDKSIPAHKLLRQAAKNGFVFPQFYGDYYANNALYLCDWVKLPPKGRWSEGIGVELPDGTHISDHLRANGIRSFEQFEKHIRDIEEDFWKRRFKVYNSWRERQVREYRKNGYLQLHTGFVCSGIMRRNEIVNYPIQGSAFHCLLFTFIELDRVFQRERWESQLVGQIHDSIIMDVVPEELGYIERELQIIVKEKLPKAWKWIIVPLDIDTERYDVDSPWIKSA